MSLGVGVGQSVNTEGTFIFSSLINLLLFSVVQTNKQVTSLRFYLSEQQKIRLNEGPIIIIIIIIIH